MLFVIGTIVMYLGLGCAALVALYLLACLIGDISGWYDISFFEEHTSLIGLAAMVIAFFIAGTGSMIRDPYLPHPYMTVITVSQTYEHVTGFEKSSKSHPYFSGTVDGEEIIFSDIIKYHEEEGTYIPADL